MYINKLKTLIHKNLKTKKNNIIFIFLYFLNFLYINNIIFPVINNFKWGFSISEYQNSGQINCNNSNWADWENSNFISNKPHIKNNQLSGKSCDFYNRYKEDIKLMKEFGINSLRFSIAWDKVEPILGKYDENVIKHYENLCDELIEAGIEPMVTLHHFVHPSWFEIIGGFEKEENIKYFLNFAIKIFDRLSNKVKLWCTINEPNIFMLQGYIRGVFPPGKSNIYLALKVLKNLLKAHTDLYLLIKKMPNGDKAQISFSHQYLYFQTYNKFNLLENIPAYFLNYILNKLPLNFLSTGEFKLPKLLKSYYKDIYYKAPEKKIIDYFAINYYSKAVLRAKFSITEPVIATCHPGEIMTDMPYPIYPQGLYDALKEVSKFKVPIYITENGIADLKDDRRDIFLKSYISAMFNAIKEGIDIRGYYYWTFTDNFEWDEGYLMKFGLFSVDYNTQERKLKEGAKYYKYIINKNKKLNIDNLNLD